MNEELWIHRLLWLNAARNIETQAWISIGATPPYSSLFWHRAAKEIGSLYSKERSN